MSAPVEILVTETQGKAYLLAEAVVMGDGAQGPPNRTPSIWSVIGQIRWHEGGI